MLNYIHDQLYFATNTELRVWFEKKIKEKFKVEVKGIANWYLATHLQKIGSDQFLDQNRYCLNLLKTHRKDIDKWSIAEGKDTPLPPGIKLTKEWPPKMKEELKMIRIEFEGLSYHGCVGSLLFLANGSRFNITFSVNKLAKFVCNPGLKH